MNSHSTDGLQPIRRLPNPNSFGAYIAIHKIHLMNLENAATLMPDAAR